ncbi:hypothetical protein ERC79_12170 [Rhodococcus sp. ABRD24]|uniref:hypothetical protein n=1 Tax=Rhodococcus sp. ABRD24 TaxID=2507582 RepID=UPI001040381A|nr:hypothetical protein [Rhodococcus sp. ABRD24]QBJ96639.1 hypothetical protein ERC79_12170 [Rhodococcus sp. ABRD24]
MKDFIRGLDPRTIRLTFGAIYLIALSMALFPPFYLASSGVRTPVLGVPWAVMYWLLDAVILGLALWALYIVEDIRGELDEDLPAASISAGGE